MPASWRMPPMGLCRRFRCAQTGFQPKRAGCSGACSCAADPPLPTCAAAHMQQAWRAGKIPTRPTRTAGDDDAPFPAVTLMMALGDVSGATLQVRSLLESNSWPADIKAAQELRSGLRACAEGQEEVGHPRAVPARCRLGTMHLSGGDCGPLPSGKPRRHACGCQARCSRDAPRNLTPRIPVPLCPALQQHWLTAGLSIPFSLADIAAAVPPGSPVINRGAGPLIPKATASPPPPPGAACVLEGVTYQACQTTSDPGFAYSQFYSIEGTTLKVGIK